MQLIVERGRARLAVEVTGEGPAVVCLHAGVTDQRSWAALRAGFPGHTVVTYDRRGYGLTSYEAEDHEPVDDLWVVLDAVGVQRAWLVGCSIGGRLAVEAALRSPERVAGLVLIAPAVQGRPEVDERPELAPLEARYDAAEAAGDVDAMNEVDACIWLDGPTRPPGTVGGAIRELFLDMNRIALAATETGERREPAQWHRLGELTMPVVAIVGEHDLADFGVTTPLLADLVPNGRCVRLSDTAHLPQLDCPALVDAIAEAVLE